ncbi:MAG: lytic transglycosylase domain-containing protein, partial [Pseudomonadota bacterium]
PASFGMIRIAPEQPETPSPGLADTLDRLSFLRGDIGAVDLTRKPPQVYRTDYDPHIAAAAYEHQIDPLLLHAIIWQESRYNRTARSHAGAIGLMQIMPETGKRFGAAKADLLDPMRNIDTGARLLRTLGARYRGNLDLMLSAYNAGEGAVARYGNRIPPFRETQNYVRKVKARYAALASGYGLSDGMQ